MVSTILLYQSACYDMCVIDFQPQFKHDRRGERSHAIPDDFRSVGDCNINYDSLAKCESQESSLGRSLRSKRQGPYFQIYARLYNLDDRFFSRQVFTTNNNCHLWKSRTSVHSNTCLLYPQRIRQVL